MEASRKRKSQKDIGSVDECEMRIGFCFNFYLDQWASRKKRCLKIQPRDQGGKKERKKVVSFHEHGLKREENVSERKKFIRWCVKSGGYLNVEKKLDTWKLWLGLRKYAFLVIEILHEYTSTSFTFNKVNIRPRMKEFVSRVS